MTRYEHCNKQQVNKFMLKVRNKAQSIGIREPEPVNYVLKQMSLGGPLELKMCYLLANTITNFSFKFIKSCAINRGFALFLLRAQLSANR